MLTLRALTMEKVFTEDLSQDSCPKSLLEEMQTLKKARNIALNHHSCRNKRRLLDMIWTNIRIDAAILTIWIIEDHDAVLEEAAIWFRMLRTEFTKQMNESRKESEKLMKCIPLEYHYMCFKNLENDYETFIYEIKQRLLELIDEHHQHLQMNNDTDATGRVQKSRNYSRHVINCLNFAF